MDSIDEKIIQILQKDGRISMQKLAKELPMSVPATCARVRKLEVLGLLRATVLSWTIPRLAKASMRSFSVRCA